MRVGARYAHFQFSPQVPVGTALGGLNQAVVRLPGWQAVGDPAPAAAEVVGYQVWVNRQTKVQFLAVIVGFQPLLVSAGQRSEDVPVPTDAGWEAAAAAGTAAVGQSTAVSEALRSMERAVRSLGGRVVPDRELLGLVKTAQERFEWWARAELKVEQLLPYLTHRCCPACQAWSKFDARWCRSCHHEFTAQENFRRDDDKANAEAEIAAMRAEGIRSVQGGPPPGPPTGAGRSGGGP